MAYTFASFLMPPLLVFGVYHLLTWFNVFRINERNFWRRIALASAISHVLLVTGFVVFAYFDFQAHLKVDGVDATFGPYLFTRSSFWPVITIFDTASMLVMLAVFSGLDRLGVNPPGLVVATFAIVYVVGTLQWFWVGGGLGALLERFWTGLKTGEKESEDEQWF